MIFNQFQNVEIFKEYLVKNADRIYINDNYEVDSKIIGLFDISYLNCSYGNSIILHEENGYFFNWRTTKQVMNEMYRINGVGFTLSKVLSSFFHLRHYLPFAYGQVAYMPMTGGSRKCTDWIGLHYVHNFHQTDGKAHFLTCHKFKLQMNFPRGDLEKRVHDVTCVCHASLVLMEWAVKGGNCELKLNPEMGKLIRSYQHCSCVFHVSFIGKMKDIHHMIKVMRDAVFKKLGIAPLERVGLLKFYRQNLAKFKKLY